MRQSMDDNPVLGLLAFFVPPELRDRWDNWSNEAWGPIAMRNPYQKGIDRDQIIRDVISYPRSFMNTHYENRREWEQSYSVQVGKDIRADLETWKQRGVETLWRALYYLVCSYRNGSVVPGQDARDIGVSDKQITHLEGWYLKEDEIPRYEEWFGKSGKEIYLPLIGKLPGLKKCDFYILFYDYAEANIWMKAKYPNTHPFYLSVLHFMYIESFENYDKSLEVAAFRQGVRTAFPKGLDYKWYVQYQLIRSWRK
jgi:hypothetical protein